LDEPTEDMAKLMFHMALLNSGFTIDSPSEFTVPLQKLINVGFGLDRDAPIEEIEIDVSEQDDDKKEEGDNQEETPADEEEINVDEEEVAEVADSEEPAKSDEL